MTKGSGASALLANANARNCVRTRGSYKFFCNKKFFLVNDKYLYRYLVYDFLGYGMTTAVSLMTIYN